MKLFKQRNKLRSPRALAAPRGGQALVEVALILPVFLVVLFGTMEMGKLAWWNHILANSVRQGARVASVGLTQQQIIDNIIQRASPIPVTSADIKLQDLPAASNGQNPQTFPNDNNTLSPPHNGVIAGDMILVTVTPQYQPILNMPFLTNLRIKQSAAMIRELEPGE